LSEYDYIDIKKLQKHINDFLTTEIIYEGQYPEGIALKAGYDRYNIKLKIDADINRDITIVIPDDFPNESFVVSFGNVDNDFIFLRINWRNQVMGNLEFNTSVSYKFYECPRGINWIRVA